MCREDRDDNDSDDVAGNEDIDCFFFFNDTATTEIYTLSLHDALPIFNQLIVLKIESLVSFLKCFLSSYFWHPKIRYKLALFESHIFLCS